MIIELKDRTGQQMISFILPNIVGFQKSGGGTLIYTSSNRDFQSENTYEEVKSKINETTRNNNNDWFNSYQEVDDFLFDKLQEIGKEFPILELNDKPELNTIEAIKLFVDNSEDWKSKYEKCIKVINKFDAGIVGMYDL